MKRWITLILPVIGLGIFVLIIRSIGLGNVVETIRGVDPRKLLIFPLFTAFIIWMHGLRWQFLMRIIGIDYSLWRSTMVWSIGFFAASVTPAKVGDAARAYYLSRDTGYNFAECLLTVVIDRLLDVFVMLALGVIAVPIFSYYYMELPSVWIALGAAMLIVGLIYLLLHRRLMRKLLGPFVRVLVPAKYREEMTLHFHSFYDALAVYIRNWKRTSIGLIYTLFFWAAVGGLAYTVTRVLDIDVSLRYLILMLPLLTLVEIIPISVSGLGTREAASIYLFSVIGVSSTEAVAFSLMYLVLGTYLVASVGLFAWLLKPRSLRKKLKDTMEPMGD